MRILFLRGRVPADRDPKQIIFNDIESCDDMWTQLAFRLGDGEIVYWGGNRITKYSKTFFEKWVYKLEDYQNNNPDVVFARGGFVAYDNVLRDLKHTYKIYYGAGERYCPQKNDIKYICNEIAHFYQSK